MVLNFWYYLLDELAAFILFGIKDENDAKFNTKCYVYWFTYEAPLGKFFAANLRFYWHRSKALSDRLQLCISRINTYAICVTFGYERGRRPSEFYWE